MPVTTPVELIVATAGDDEDQDPAAQLAMVTDEPAQTEEGPEMAPASGKGFTITATVAVLLHPFSVPVTVYVALTDGLAATDAPVVADSPLPGVHE